MISFQLKLFAHTYDEFISIYKKMNHLTSLCYPAYQESRNAGFSGKMRMKPPYTKMVIGDYLGRMDYGGNDPHAELTGFLKSITYNVPDEAVWEAGLDQYFNNVSGGHHLQAPKYIIANIQYQVTHVTPPSLEYTKGLYGERGGDFFYGLVEKFGGDDINVKPPKPEVAITEPDDEWT